MVTFHSVLKVPLVGAFFLAVSVLRSSECFLSEVRFVMLDQRNPCARDDHGGSLDCHQGLSMIFWGKNPMTLPPFSGETPLLFMGAAVMPRASGFWNHDLRRNRSPLFLSKNGDRKSHESCGCQSPSAALTGIPVDRMIFLSFTLSGALGRWPESF